MSDIHLPMPDTHQPMPDTHQPMPVIHRITTIILRILIEKFWEIVLVLQQPVLTPYCLPPIKKSIFPTANGMELTI
jgi:hypothetical protein